MRITVRVRPGSSRPRVGGAWQGTEPPALEVAVAARAVDGRANDAVVDAVAAALGVRRSDVSIVAGRTSRTKVLEVVGDDPAVAERLDGLLADRSGG